MIVDQVKKLRRKKKIWPGKYGDTDNNKSIVLCLNISGKKDAQSSLKHFDES